MWLASCDLQRKQVKMGHCGHKGRYTVARSTFSFRSVFFYGQYIVERDAN